MARDRLELERLRAALRPRWQRVDVVAETASTNADLLAAADAPDRTVLAAEYQHAGRGRLDRVWQSPAGAGLTFSALLRPEVPMQRWGWLPLLAGVAVHEAVDEYAGVGTALKWPNDLLADADDRKLAGILAQTSGEAVVLGVGINVDTATEELPIDAATSLRLMGAGDLDRTGLLIAVLTRLDEWYARWSRASGDAAVCGLSEAYRRACTSLGRTVRVSLGSRGSVSGQAVGLDEIGRLIVATDEGEQAIGAGDVEHLR